MYFNTKTKKCLKISKGTNKLKLKNHNQKIFEII